MYYQSVPHVLQAGCKEECTAHGSLFVDVFVVVGCRRYPIKYCCGVFKYPKFYCLSLIIKNEAEECQMHQHFDIVLEFPRRTLRENILVRSTYNSVATLYSFILVHILLSLKLTSHITNCNGASNEEPQLQQPQQRTTSSSSSSYQK